MKKLSMILGPAAVLVIGSAVYAKNEAAGQGTGSQGTTTQTQQRLMVSPSPVGAQVQNRVETQNAGEDSQLQVNTQQETSGVGMPKSLAPRSAAAQENMSVASQKVEELLTTKTTRGGIGDEVRQIAQDQKLAQDEIETELVKVDSRGRWLKVLAGPDYKAMRNIQQLMEQNRLRIQQLEQLQIQVTNQGDIAMVQETVQALIDQNTALEDRVALEERTGSVFGWLFKLFTR
jgi:hypothetical protein